MKKLSPLFVYGCSALLSVFALSGCSDSYNSPYGGYGDPYYGGSGYGPDDYHRRREWEQRREEHELERDRRRLEEERRRFEDEKRRNPPSAQAPYTPPRVQEHCPSGFSPSEAKCSPEERRRGCKDVRLPGGLGCVKR